MSDTIIIPKEGRLVVTQIKVDSYLNTLTLKLFKNDIVPDVDTIASDFDEADFPGYASQSLTDFGAPFINGNDNAESDTGVHTFLCTGVPGGGTQSIYGWYAVDGDGTIGPCAKFVDDLFDPDPIVLTGSGQTVSVQILFEDGGLAPP